MLHILDDLRDRVNQGLGREESSFDRKKDIIGQNLYGVDVMEWACHVAELRLWLALVIDAEFSPAELHLRNEPLLPHFSFNIRCGDSLVQEIGGMNLATLRDAVSGVPRALKARITRLKNAKLQFFNNDPTCPYRSEKELEQEELRIFRELIDTRTTNIEEQIDGLQQQIDGPRERQMRLDGTVEERTDRQLELQAMEWQKQIETLTENLNHLKATRSALASARGVPFVWDIAFVEVFTSEKAGVDIVIGNPPYVRQESIANPKIPIEGVTTENKKAHKAKLARSVYQAFPRFFNYKREKDIKPDDPSPAVSHKLDAKSDLYIYFYFHGLSLLNPEGTFCFVTSHSWLDVSYGKDLQEFTLKHCHIKQIIDNEVRRSFDAADVNTVICLFSAPDEKRESELDQTARFVMFKTPFEGVLDAVIFEEVEEAEERRNTPEHRIFPISQRDLLEEGSDDASSDAKYTGDQWGGKYLRAPDIYWTILEKGKDKLVRLGDVAEVRFGIKTGANKFFYLDNQKIQEWGIEEEFLKPVIFSLRELVCIEDDLGKLQKKIFLCHEKKSDLIGTNALKYIEWGESQSFNKRPSCKSRRLWYSFAESWNSAPFIFPAKVGERMLVLNNLRGVFEDKKLYGITPLETHEGFIFAGLLNSTLVRFFMDLSCRQLTGGQAIADIDVRIVKEIPILSICLLADNKQAFKQAYDQIKSRPIDQRIAKEYTMSDRRALDEIIFDALNLTQGERDGVYEAVIHLVEARLQKASSLRGG